MLHSVETSANPSIEHSKSLLDPVLLDYINATKVPTLFSTRETIASKGYPEINALKEQLFSPYLSKEGNNFQPAIPESVQYMYESAVDFVTLVSSTAKFDSGLIRDNRVPGEYEIPPTIIMRKTAFFHYCSDFLAENESTMDSNSQLVIFDINGLNTINSQFGELAGNRKVQETAYYLQSVLLTINASMGIGLEGKDQIGRIGGDEFALFITGSKQEVEKKLLLLRDYVTQLTKDGLLSVSKAHIIDLQDNTLSTGEREITQESLLNGQIPESGVAALHSLINETGKSTDEVVESVQNRVKKIKSSLSEIQSKITNISNKLDGEFISQITDIVKTNPIFKVFIKQAIVLDRALSKQKGQTIKEYDFPLTKWVISSLYENLYNPASDRFDYDANILDFLMRRMKNYLFLRLNPDIKEVNDQKSHSVGDKIIEKTEEIGIQRLGMLEGDGVFVAGEPLFSQLKKEYQNRVSITKAGPELIFAIDYNGLSKEEKDRLLGSLQRLKQKVTSIPMGAIEIPIGVDYIDSKDLESSANPILESKQRTNVERMKNTLSLILSLTNSEFDDFSIMIQTNISLKKSGIEDQVDFLWKSFSNNRRAEKLKLLYSIAMEMQSAGVDELKIKVLNEILKPLVDKL
jgi:GGDEF domain-containing protein